MPFVSFGHVALGTECHVTRNMCKRGGVRRVYFGTISCPPLQSRFVMAAVYDIPIFAVRKSEFTCVNQRTDNETKEDFRDYMITYLITYVIFSSIVILLVSLSDLELT